MPTKPGKGQVRVRGTCKAGHTTEARSDPGRVTWEGTCSTEGCELPVKARRMPRERPEVSAPATPAPAEDVDDPKLRKVSYGAPQPKPRGTARTAAAAERKPGDPAQPAAAADLPGAGGERPADEGPAAARVDAGDGPTRRGLRGRLAARRQARGSARFALPWED